MSQLLERGEDGGDLVGAFFGFAAEAGGERFGVLAGGGQEFADGSDLGGQVGGPGEDFDGKGAGRAVGGISGFGAGQGRGDGSGGGCLVIGAEVADEAALLLGGALVVEGDEAGEEFLLGRFSEGGTGILPVGVR